MQEKNIKGLIICGFPGIGKSGVEQRSRDMGISRYHDLESTPYRWKDVNNRDAPNPHFAEQYVDAIELFAGPYSGYDVIMVSTHREVRAEMKKRGIPYIIVIPEKSLKDEYLLRYVARGSDYGLISEVFANWDKWLDELESDGAPVIHLKSGQFLADVIVPEIVRENLQKTYRIDFFCK